MENINSEDLLKKVIEALRKKKKELQEKGKEWTGVYHNGCWGFSPSWQLTVSTHSNLEYSICYCVGGRMWNWIVNKTEFEQ